MGTPTDLYRCFDKLGQLLYIGTTNSGWYRWKQEMKNVWWPDVAWVKVDHFADLATALHAETTAIRTERPLYNIRGSSNSRPRPRLSGERIRAARRRAALSQATVAHSIGLNVGTIRTWESGKAQPIPENARRLAECLGTTVDALWVEHQPSGLTPDQAQAPKASDADISLNHLARWLQVRVDPDAARPLLERALAIRERVLGPAHPDTVATRRALAGLGGGG